MLALRRPATAASYAPAVMGGRPPCVVAYPRCARPGPSAPATDLASTVRGRAWTRLRRGGGRVPSRRRQSELLHSVPPESACPPTRGGDQTGAAARTAAPLTPRLA